MQGARRKAGPEAAGERAKAEGAASPGSPGAAGVAGSEGFEERRGVVSATVASVVGLGAAMVAGGGARTESIRGFRTYSPSSAPQLGIPSFMWIFLSARHS